MMSSHSLIGLVQSFFTKSDVEAEDPMMAMKLALHGWSWYDGQKIKPVCALVTVVTLVAEDGKHGWSTHDARWWA